MEKGMFFRDVGATESRGTAHVEEEEVREEWGRPQRPRVQNDDEDHLTACYLLMSAA
jgi:hypothetical protein